MSAGAAFAAGAAAGAAGSIASQLVGLATGTIDKFSWKEVAFSAITAGVTKGLGASKFATALRATKLGVTGTQVVTGAAGSLISQGIGVATGLQEKFSWTGVAVAGVVSGVSAAVSNAGWLTNGPAGSWEGMVNDLVSGAAGAIAGAATQTALDGTSFGDNLIAVLPSVIASTIGNAVAGGMGIATPPPLIRGGEKKF